MKLNPIFAFALITFYAFPLLLWAANPLKVESPDKKLTVEVSIGSKISYSVKFKNKPVFSPSNISLTLDNGKVLGQDAEIKDSRINEVNTQVKTYLYKRESITNSYNELTINLKGNYGLFFRAYNEGVAYRFFTHFKGDITIFAEDANFNLATDGMAWLPYPKDSTLFTSFENTYDTVLLSKVKPFQYAFLPVLAAQPEGVKVLITEADLFSYPGMFVRTLGKQGFKGFFAKVPSKTKQDTGASVSYDWARPVSWHPYIAKCTGERNFPWRVMVITDNDADLADNDLIYKLARPNVLGDVSWVKPGKASWEWWNGIDLTHVDFKVGINTATYKYYIDFAAKNKLEYLVLDEGWAKDLSTMLDVVPEVNLQELVDYGRRKNVGLVLWGSCFALNNNLKAVCEKYGKMGIKGFKIDFFDRDDQLAVEMLERMLQEAANHKLFLDFHGTSKPVGLNRTYPNEVGREGVYGLENYKWTDKTNLKYHVQLPFIRGAVGATDFTPGAMKNDNDRDFKPVFNHPHAKGTRCNQLAMYLVYDAPFGMLADSPQNYEHETDALDFLSKVPTTWDETRIIDAKMGEYIITARRKGKVWYVGAMTDNKARILTLKPNFIKGGEKKVDLYEDGLNANRNASDYKRSSTRADSNSEITLNLAAGGGAVLIFSE